MIFIRKIILDFIFSLTRHWNEMITKIRNYFAIDILYGSIINLKNQILNSRLEEAASEQSRRIFVEQIIIKMNFFQ